MKDRKIAYKLSGFITLAISLIVYFITVQRTGSLWDVGEFILGSYKLQVVHPPGAPLFLLIGQLFTWVGDIVSSDPAMIGFATNLQSAIFSSLACMFGAWTIFHFGKLSLVDRQEETSSAQNLVLMLAGIAGGLSAAFCIAIWFSAVEGEVYAMSFFFTTLTLWAMTVWYIKPDDTKENDRWILLALYSAGLSTGVHLLSLLTLPAVGLLYYFKRYQKVTPRGLLAALVISGAILFFVQKVVIVGLPTLWYYLDYLMVNSFGLPVNSGIFPTLLILVALGYYGLRYAHKKNNHLIQLAVLAAIMISTGFSTIGVVVIRANANTPINMNAPTDPSRLLPYINREQYGDRPLLYGPSFDAIVSDYEFHERYGYDGKKYTLVDYKVDRIYDAKDKMLFPRMGHNDPLRIQLYQQEWMGRNGTPTFIENVDFFFKYQINWMYFRYLFQNFIGRDNATQGYTPANVADGNWASGIKFIDEFRLYEKDAEPSFRKNDEGRNGYFFLPFILGIIGMVFLFKRRRRDFFTLLLLFVLTGIGLIIYANSPPHEPRERDYVFAGSFFTFAMFIGFSVIAIFEFLRERIRNLPITGAAIISGGLVLTAPLLMAFQNYDDMGRREQYASRDYAANFLKTLEKNALIFTYGDNDTYPLWYVQEVENVRTDVRVVNLSLISVDWYINLLRSKMNDSEKFNLTLSEDAIRGYKRNQVFLINPEDPSGKGPVKKINVETALHFINSDRSEHTRAGSMSQFVVPGQRFVLNIDKSKALESGWAIPSRADEIAENMVFNYGDKSITKDELAITDIIVNNIYTRPIYFAMTVQQDKLIGLEEYMEIEGLAMRITPYVHNEESNQMSLFGIGGVNSDKVLKLFREEYNWGNFDKVEQFVDESFGPAIQAHRMVALRALEEFTKKGEYEKAAELATIYLGAFPNMNFTYSYEVIPFIRALVANGDMQLANKTTQTVLSNSIESAEFLQSLKDSGMEAKTYQLSFGRSDQINRVTLQQLRQLAQSYPDEAMKQKITNSVNPYLVNGRVEN